jgi:hypothetical protein
MTKYILDFDEEQGTYDNIRRNKGKVFNCLEDALVWISSYNMIGILIEKSPSSKIYIYELYYDKGWLFAILVPEVK